MTELTKYNPAFLSDEDLVENFVGRAAQLALISRILRENARADSNQHLLLVGARGMGKTTLAHRVAIASREGSTPWFPITFAEESYGVTTTGEFWLEALFQLGQQSDDPEWIAAHASLLEEESDARLREGALAHLLDFAHRRGQRLLLVVENLNQLLGDQISSDDAWALRHTLQAETSIMLLGTATVRFKEIETEDQAFFELFRVIDVPPMTDEECAELWEVITESRPSANRLRPIRILTGGNPRLLRIIAPFAVNLSLSDLMANLLRLVDEHTEYFRSYLERLAPQERKVLLALAEIWDPALAREVAAHARLSSSEASAQLARLVGKGAVTARDDGRKKRYQVSERLYNVYYLLRRRGSQARRVRALANFIVAFYEPTELVAATRRIAEEAVELPPDCRQDHFWTFQAIVTNPAAGAYRDKLIAATPDRFVACLAEDRTSDWRDVLRAFEDREPTAGHEPSATTEPRPDGHENANDGAVSLADRAEAEAHAEENPDSAEAQFQLLEFHLRENDPQAAALAAERAAEIVDDPEARILAARVVALTDKETAAERLQRYAREYADDASLLADVAEAFLAAARPEDALSTASRAVEVDPSSYPGWIALAHARATRPDELSEAIHAFRTAIEVASNSAEQVDARLALGRVLARDQQPESALLEYTAAIEATPSEVPAAHQRRGSLLRRMGRLSESENDLRAAVDLDDSALNWSELGLTLRELGDFEGAEEAHLAALDRHEAWWCFDELAELYRDNGRPEEAIEVLQRGLAVVPENGRAPLVLELARCYEVAGNVEQAKELLLEISRADPENPLIWHDLGGFYGRQDRVDEAIGAYEHALELRAPGSFGCLWSHLAQLETRRDRPETAVKILRRGLKEDPTEHQLRRELALALVAADRRDAAEETARTATDLDSSEAEDWDLLAYLIGLAQDRWLEAESAARAGLEMFPNNPKLITRLVKTLINQEKPAEAVDLLTRVLVENEHPALRFELAHALYHDEQYDEAAAGLQGLLETDPDNPSVRMLLAGVLAAQDQFSESIELVLGVAEDTTITSSKRAGALVRIASLPVPDENLDHAYDRMAGMIPDLSDAVVANEVAWALYERGGSAALGLASRFIQETKLGDADDPMFIHTRACVHAALGDLDAGLKETERLLQNRDFTEENLSGVIALGIELAAAGAGDDIVAAIEAADLSAVLQPLVTAINLTKGLQVDVAAEVREVAEDVVARIEEVRQRSRNGPEA